MKKIAFFNLLLCCSFQYLIAQQDSTDLSLPQEQIKVDIIEDFIQSTGGEEEFEFNDLFESLEHFTKSPLNLNTASREELAEIPILSDIQINDLIQYRKKYGNLIALQELQAIPSFDLRTIYAILPFVATGGSVDDYQVPLLEMLSKGRNEVLARWRRTLEEQRGFKEYTSVEYGTEGEIINRKPNSNPYLGDPNSLYIRYKHTYENRLSYGVTMEKDAGEEFFTGSNKQGFDFYSAHLHLKNYSRFLKDIAIGDFSVSFGQGLILYTGFGRGKSSDVMNIKRGARTIRGYSSVNEVNFYRGAGITLRPLEHVEASLFVSFRNRDGNIAFQDDTLDTDVPITEFSSLQTSGLHRTAAEINDKNSIQQTVVGGNVKYQRDGWHIGLNALFNKLNKELNPATRLYSKFYFRGDKLFNASVDYSYIFQNINFFGETAISDNRAIATTNGLLLGLDRNIDLSILYRDFARDYQALDANSFGESRSARNEKGLYIGTEIRPFNHWKVAAYFDLYQHPWLQFDADAPSKGYDFQGRITYYLKRKLSAYLHVKYEREEENLRGYEGPVDILSPFQTFRIRLQFNNQLNKELELRTRIAWGFAKNESTIDESGSMIYQDVIYRPKFFPLSFSARLAYFDTPSFNVRFYAYENDILNSFTVPPYYNQGTKFYLNLRYRGIRKLTLEARFAQTYWRGEEGYSLGSGQEILGPTRSEVKAQIKYIF